MTLRVLGTIYTVTKSNLVIVKIENVEKIPRIGDQVFNANNDYIGRIIDVIGPISSPFAVLRPVKQSILSMLKPSTLLFYKPRRSVERGRR